MTLSPEAETLKTEGNTLYSKGDYKAALGKYTAAINVASDSPVLFANRAAARLGLKRYEEALEDAVKAAELDPKYAKGWGRMAAAFEGLKNYSKAKDAYSRAIECIDATSPISDADKRLKAQYKQSHTNMELLSGARHVVVNETARRDMKTPWELAKEIKRTLPENSSGHVILEAADCFEEATSMLKSVRRVSGMMGGQTGGTGYLSNAILTDDRCVYMKGEDSLFESINKYLQFEAMQCGAWNERKPQEVIRLAKERLRQTNGNWDRVRPALSCQARSWIILGHFGQLSEWSRDEIYTWYDRACKLIELGRVEWAHVHRDDRGTIFDDTFLRGVQVVRMNEYLQAYAVPHLRTKGKFTLDGLLALADEIIDKLETIPDDEIPTQPLFFRLAFYIYPKASAWSSRGYAYFRKASFQDASTVLEDREWARKAGEAYLKAADLYPEDDEYHCMMLQTALECYSSAKTKASEMLDIMERLRLAYPKMQRIWRNSNTAMQGGHKKLVQIMDAEEEFRKALDEGKFKLDDPIMLQVQSDN